MTMRLAAICFAIMLIAVIKASGIPSLSVSLAIAAPLRVSDPQVDTSNAASTPSVFMSRAISLPMTCIVDINACTPVVA